MSKTRSELEIFFLCKVCISDFHLNLLIFVDNVER